MGTISAPLLLDAVLDAAIIAVIVLCSEQHETTKEDLGPEE